MINTLSGNQTTLFSPLQTGMVQLISNIA